MAETNGIKRGNRFKDLTGRQFDRLTVISCCSERAKSGGYQWVCVCKCGNECVVSGALLATRHKQSCGCLHPKTTADQKAERRAAYHKQYREKHREHLLETHRQYNAEKREVLKEKARQYYAENREQCREMGKKYYAENRELVIWQAAQYAKENPEVRRRANRKYSKSHPEQRRLNDHRRRARKAKSTVGDGLAITTWEKKWRSRKTVVCHWCRKRVKTSDVHVDHVVPLSQGGAHAVENLCVSCPKCNLSKNAKPPEVWNASLSQPLLFV